MSNQKIPERCLYGTLNTLRSAISLISSNKIGKDEIVTRFLTGCFKTRPSKPKYDYTWDVGIVIKFLSKLHPLKDLSLKELSIKTATLLALSTAHRMQTLSLIKISNFRETSNGLEIRITDTIKTSGPDTYQPLLIIPKFEKHPEICVYSCVKEYLTVTKPLRKSIDKLLITTTKPHKAASPQTLSNWVKNAMLQSGIDTSIFKAHSVRHATSSAALLKGINIDVIRKTATWSKGSQVFAKFYNRPIISDDGSFAHAVILNKHNK